MDKQQFIMQEYKYDPDNVGLIYLAKTSGQFKCKPSWNNNTPDPGDFYSTFEAIYNHLRGEVWETCKASHPDLSAKFAAEVQESLEKAKAEGSTDLRIKIKDEDWHNFSAAMDVVGLYSNPSRDSGYGHLMEDIWGTIWELGDEIALSETGDGDNDYQDAFSRTRLGSEFLNRHIPKYVEVWVARSPSWVKGSTMYG